LVVNNKLRVAVLDGGDSTEREVSLRSGRAVVEILRSRGWDVVEIDAATDYLRRFRESGAGVAFLALHGAFGEDGRIQRVLENEHIPYTGSGPEASRKGMDKPLSKELMAAAGVCTPDFILIEPQAGPGAAAVEPTAGDGFLAEAARKLGFPIVVKPPCGGSSVGVAIARDAAELAQAVSAARRYETNVLLERYVPGRELTVAVLNGSTLPVIEIICPGFFDYQAKYTKGVTEYVVKPALSAAVESAVRSAALETYRCLGCSGAARVDIRLDPANVPWVLEINTIPGLTATSLLPKAAKAVGIEFGELCERMIADALERHAQNSGDNVVEERASA